MGVLRLTAAVTVIATTDASSSWHGNGNSILVRGGPLVSSKEQKVPQQDPTTQCLPPVDGQQAAREEDRESTPSPFLFITLVVICGILMAFVRQKLLKGERRARAAAADRLDPRGVYGDVEGDDDFENWLDVADGRGGYRACAELSNLESDLAKGVDRRRRRGRQSPGEYQDGGEEGVGPLLGGSEEDETDVEDWESDAPEESAMSPGGGAPLGATDWGEVQHSLDTHDD